MRINLILGDTVSGTIGTEPLSGELTTAGSNKRERKRKNLIRLGVNPRDAFSWSRSRPGGWAIAQSPILNTTITVELLCKRSYEPMLTWYRKVVLHKFTPTLFPVV